MTTPIKLSPEVLDLIKKQEMIIIAGETGSGKTTEASEIAKSLNKPVKVIIPNEHTADTKLFDDCGFEKIVTDEGSSNIQKAKSKLNKAKNCVIIYNDFQEVSVRQRNNIGQLTQKLRHEHIHLILVYHGETIPKKYLKKPKCILIAKWGSGLSDYKLRDYFEKKYISASGKELCKIIKGYDSVYLGKDGKYFHRDGMSNKIIRGNLKPKGRATISKKRLTNAIIKDKLTQKEVANKFGVSANLVYKYIKWRKETDAEWKKSYENLKKSKSVSKKSKIGKRLKSGVSLHITTEKLYNLGNKNMRQIVYLNSLQDIGDFAVEVVGDGIHKGFVEVVNGNLIQYAEIYITKAREGCDIRIEKGKDIIEIEIKNIKKTPQKKHITKSTIERDVKPRFSKDATEKWLFTCGLGCNDVAKQKLKENDINYKRLSYKQLVSGDRDRKHHIKKLMRQFVYEELLGLSLPV